MHFLLLFYLVLSTCKCEQWFKHNTYEYFFGSEVANFQTAMSQCRAKNSNLVVIRNPQIHSFLIFEIFNNIAYIINRRDYYIGLKRINYTKDGFEWVDGTPVSSGYTAWAIGEPNNAVGLKENCTFMWHIKNYMWNDASCRHKAKYICQRLIKTSTENAISTPGQSSISESTTSKRYFEQQPNMNFLVYIIPLLVVVILLLIAILVVLFIRRQRLKVISGNNSSEQHVNNEIQMENNHQATNPVYADQQQSNIYLEPIKLSETPVVENAYALISKIPNLPQDSDGYTMVANGSQETAYENVIKSNEPYVNVSEAPNLPLDVDGYAVLTVDTQSNVSK